MELLHVLVYKIILADHRIVAQNVQSMQNVQEILLALMTNVGIRAPDHVVYTRHVIQLNMYHNVFVKMDTLEIHLVDVHSYNKVRFLIYSNFFVLNIKNSEQ